VRIKFDRRPVSYENASRATRPRLTAESVSSQRALTVLRRSKNRAFSAKVFGAKGGIYQRAAHMIDIHFMYAQFA
jgi:hypothetical protein